MISCELLQSLRGHSAVVNGTKFLSYDVAGRLSHDTNGHMVVSAGLDCSVKVWHVTRDTSRCLRLYHERDVGIFSPVIGLIVGLYRNLGTANMGFMCPLFEL